MNEENEQLYDHLEPLLRRWGAKEAVELAEMGDLASSPAPAVRPAAAMHRWWPLAAAAILFVTSIALFVVSQYRPASGPVQDGTTAMQEETKRLKSELMLVQSSLDKANERLIAQKESFEQQLASLRKTFGAERNALATETEERLRALSTAVDEKKSLLERAAGQLAASEQELAELEKRVQGSETARTQMLGQIAQLREQQQAAAQARIDAESKLAAIEGERSAWMNGIVNFVKASAAAGQDSLQTRQAAARQGRLLERCALLRVQARDEKTKDLFDTLEVILTRFDLLDAQNDSDLVSLARLISRAHVSDQINNVLEVQTEPEEVNVWLVETNLMLTGVDRAY